MQTSDQRKTAGTGPADDSTPRTGRRASPHAVQFYETDSALCGAVSAFLAEGLMEGESIVLFGRPATRVAVRRTLVSIGLDLDGEERKGRVHLLDAEETLESFLVGGRPDAKRFDAVVGGAFRRLAQALPGESIRAFGEIVDVLWERGERECALLVEAYWNQIVAAQPVRLLCAYALSRFANEAEAGAFAAVCEQHEHVIPAESFATLTDEEARARQVAELQRRARSLEAEIEQRKTLEAALREALLERDRVADALKTARDEAQYASRAKSEFLAVMSHELRTPLNAIIGYDELLAMEVGGAISDEQRTFVERIRSAAQQLLALVDQILSLSRIEAGKEEVSIEDADVAQIVRDATSLVAADARLKGLVLETADCDRAVHCRTDPHKVRQIVLNLLANAVKFTDSGRIDVTMRNAGNEICVDVRDTGVGLDRDDRERIFDAFVQVDSTSTRSQGGTGLGLAVSRRMARLLNGDVAVTDGGPGIGSTFTLRLPADRATA